MNSSLGSEPHSQSSRSPGGSGHGSGAGELLG